jgi:hypothetical protein
MADIKRELIGSIELDKTKGGKPVVSLFSTDTRLQFPVLRLFDLSALEVLGIDPNTLGADRVYRRFWAYYTESEKTTAQGTAYRDVEYLEALDAPASTTSVDTSGLLRELAAIRALLQVMAQAQGLPLPAGEPEADAPPEGDVEETPDVFPTPEAAIAWGFAQGAFRARQHAENAYGKLKREKQPSTAEEMAALWVVDVVARLKALATEEEEDPTELARAFPRYGDGTSPDPENAAELVAFGAFVDTFGKEPVSKEDLRKWYATQQRAARERGKDAP